MEHIQNIVFIVLVIIIAMVVSIYLVKSMSVQAPQLDVMKLKILGGADAGALGDADAPPASGHRCSIGDALYQHARALTREDTIGLPQSNISGGGKMVANKIVAKRQPAAKLWTSCESWDALKKDEELTAAYMSDRTAAIDNPIFDWSSVMASIIPLLQKNHEYIGIANVEPGSTLVKITAMESSPIKAGTMSGVTDYAGVPSKLVAKYANRPAMFLFHTHPADLRGSPLPSSQDLVTAINFGATARFAASIMISRYGVFMYGPDWNAYRAISQAKEWKLALLNFSHDVVAGHEAVRSWSEHTVSDYFSFYPRFRMFLNVFPLPELIGDTRRFKYMWDLESPVDHDLIREHVDDITAHHARTKNELTATDGKKNKTTLARLPKLGNQLALN